MLLANTSQDANPNPARPASRACPLRRGQRVLVAYGCVQIMQAVGKFAVGGRVLDRRKWRKGWLGIELGNGTLVTAHLSAISRL